MPGTNMDNSSAFSSPGSSRAETHSIARPIRTGVNVYSRPGAQQQLQCQTSSQASPANATSIPAESPKRGSLFGSLRLGKYRKESKCSPGQSPVGSIDQDSTNEQHSEAPSPRKLSGLWETFRPRSKSDTRPRKTSASGGRLPSTNVPGWPMASIPSVDEEALASSPPKRKSPEGVTKPLFVDTQLANRRGNSTKRDASSLVSRSPIAQVVERISVRRRSLSGNTAAMSKFEADRKHIRTPSGPPGADHFYANTGSYAMGKDGKNRVLYAQRSLDSGLECSSPNSASMFREAPFFLGSTLHGFNLENEEYVYSQFMKSHQCYDVVPTSAKLVAFDTQLSVKKAFYALVYNGVRAAPLWDSVAQQFVGMLTITDFIHILHRYYKSGASQIKELEEHKIATWRDVLAKDGLLKPFVTIDAADSLYKAVQLLCESKVHRLPVTDRSTGNILYILTHKRILRFLYIYIFDLPMPKFLDKTPKELGLGTWGPIFTVQQDAPLVDALSRFFEHRVSALPVLDVDGKLVDIYARFDVINLAADKAYINLDISVKEALKHRSEWFEGVRTCKETDSLAAVLETLVKAEVHRIIVTDSEKRVTGMVSLSDILGFLILRSSNDCNVDNMDIS